MEFCSLLEATHIYVLNYDEQVSIVKKERKNFWTSDRDSKNFTYFVNRYMTYIID